MRFLVVACLSILLQPASASAAGNPPTGPRDSDPRCDPAGSTNTIQAGGQVLGSLSAATHPRDVWKIEVPDSASSTLVLNVTLTLLTYNQADPGGTNFDLTVCDPAGKVIGGSATLRQFESDSLLALDPGTYRLNLTAAKGAGEYALDAFLDDPKTVVNGDVLPGRVIADSRQAATWYKIRLYGGTEAEAVDARLVEIERTTDSNVDVWLVDRWARFSFWPNVSWTGDPVEEVRGVASYTGWYYVKVLGFRGNTGFRISFTVTSSTADGDNVPANATFLAYNATVQGTVDQAMDHYDFFRVTLADGERIDLRLDLLTGSHAIFFLRILDPALALVWDQSNYIFTKPPDVGSVVSVSRVPGPGSFFVLVDAKVALAPDVNDTSDATAHADYRLRVNMSLHAPHPPNTAPQTTTAVPASLTLDEDATETIALGTWFEDPEADRLAYGAAASGDLIAEVDADGVLTIAGLPDWSGCGKVSVTATDPGNLSARLDLPVCVRDLPEPPVISAIGPGPGDPLWDPLAGGVRINETERVTFRLTVTDRDTPGVLLTVRWTLDDGVVALRNATNATITYTYGPSYGDRGLHRIRVNVTDGGRSATAAWSVQVLARNRPPAILSFSPSNGSRVDPQEAVFRGRAVDADGDPITWVWSEGLTPLGSGKGTSPNLTTTLTPGRHVLTLAVTDGKAWVNRTVRVDANAGLDVGANGVPLLIVLVVIAVVAVLLLLVLRRGDDETKRGRERGRERGTPSRTPYLDRRRKGHGSGGRTIGKKAKKTGTAGRRG